jgi:dipeptidyl-peptidase-4
VTVFGQDRLPNHPKYKAYQAAQQASRQITTAIGLINASGWSADSRYVELHDGKAFDMHTQTINDYKPDPSNPTSAPAGRGGGRLQPGRGRQFSSATSPDGKWTAKYENSNLYLVDAQKPTDVKAITKDGNAEKRIKYGTGSWVYGEELGQRDAIWWSPDSTKVVYYRFDESQVKDYFVTLSEGDIQNKLYTEAYPKAGAPNPLVQLLVYDLATKQSTKIDTEFKSSDPDISQYIYNIRFAPDGHTLLFYRTNRKQNVMELCAANPSTGACRVVIQETSPIGWVENNPPIQWLADGKRFLWMSEKTGYWNIYMASLDKGVTDPITRHGFAVESIVKVDEKKGQIWYYSHSAPNPNLVQLHRINFDGTGEVGLTDPSLSHSVQIAPDASGFIDRAEALNIAPTLRVCDAEGKVLKVVGTADISEQTKAGYKPAEEFSCMAADGTTKIYGYIQKPSDFNPSKKYPVILSVYGGPDSGSGRQRFIGNDAQCEFGFIHAWIDGRGTRGRGRDFRESVYRKLGIVEIDDQAAAMQALEKEPFIDGAHIGIEGTSYGGYASLMCLVRHPETFAAAVSGSPVTAWYHYDSIYTERFMDTPQNNPDGYKMGSAMEYAKDLKGSLCLYIGTADDNVHPSNTWQMINALDKAGKPYRLYAGVDQGHSALQFARRMEYFIDALQSGSWTK